MLTDVGTFSAISLYFADFGKFCMLLQALCSLGMTE